MLPRAPQASPNRGYTESMVAVRSSVGRSTGTRGAKTPWSDAAAVAGGAWLNFPVSGSMAKSPGSGSSWVPSDPNTPELSSALVTFEAECTGTTARAARCDSRLAGPDTKEFTSNAVTA